MSRRTVVVTGLGVVSPVSSDLDRILGTESEAGSPELTGFSPWMISTSIPVTIGGEVRDLDVERYVDAKEARKMDPFSLYGVAAAIMAVEDASVEP